MKSLLHFRRPLLLMYCATWALRQVRTGPRAALFLLMLCSLSAMTGCTIGPTVEVRHVLIHPGQPLRILENVSATGERLDGGGVATHDLGGWVAMPPSHWQVIKGILDKSGMNPAPPVSDARKP